MVRLILLGSVIAALAGLTARAAVVAIAALRRGGRREYREDEPDAVARSRFTIPVSVIVPVDGSAREVRATVEALLALRYAEFEVIVVADGTARPALDALTRAWGLSAHEFFYRQSVITAQVRRICCTAREPRLMVVEKPAAGRADSLNCGMNLARFRYVAVVDPGVQFDREALLRAMVAPLRDPANVVAASSHVEIRPDDTATVSGAWQQLDSIRSLMDSGLVWRRLPHGLGPPGGVVVWQRDALLDAGGFSAGASDPDLDMMVRLGHLIPDGDARRVLRTTEIFGWTGAKSPSDWLKLRTHEYRAAIDAMRTWRSEAAFARRSMAYFIATRVGLPVLELWALVGAAAAAAAGWMPWRDVALSILLLSLGHALVTAAALLLRGSATESPDQRRLWHLLLLSPFEFVAFGPIVAWACAVGVWQTLLPTDVPPVETTS